LGIFNQLLETRIMSIYRLAKKVCNFIIVTSNTSGVKVTKMQVAHTWSSAKSPHRISRINNVLATVRRSAIYSRPNRAHLESYAGKGLAIHRNLRRANLKKLCCIRSILFNSTSDRVVHFSLLPD
jgi:hypothetical protein